MNNEIKEILRNCEKTINEASGYNDTTDKIIDYITNLQRENERFRTQLNIYDNPDDLTLFYMWLDEKAKDKMKELHQENERLKNRIEEITKIYQNESRYRTELETKHVQLQQKNERLTQGVTMLTNKLIDMTEAKEVYKSRIDKAVEHIEKHQFIFQSQYGDESNFDNHLLDILKGDDENEER